MNDELLHNPTAGEILQHEFLDEISMSQDALAKAINVSVESMQAVINGTQPVTADLDLKLCRLFNLSEGYFLRLQNAYETMEAKRKLGEELTKIQPFSPKRF